MTPAQRAAEFPLEFCPAGEGHDPGVDRAIDCQKCREEAFRACADEALERAAVEADSILRDEPGRTVVEIPRLIRALKTGGSHGR